MMISYHGNASRVTGTSSVGETILHVWIPIKTASDVGLWDFLRRQSEQTAEATGLK